MTEFYQLVENYCDWAVSYTNIIESFTDKDVAEYWCELFNKENQCSYTDYYVYAREPLEHTMEDLLDNVLKYESEIYQRYNQWVRM